MESFGNYYHKKNSRNSSGSSSDSNNRKHVQFYTSNNNKVTFQNGRQNRPRKLPNTRQLKPECIVESRKIRQIISEVLRRNLWEESYDADHCNMLAMMTSEQIKTQVKLLNMTRYKIVCMVTVGSKSGQKFLQASRCLLNTEFDEIISESFENASVFAVGVVYAFYQE
jgi:X breakpoint 2-interacting protein